MGQRFKRSAPGFRSKRNAFYYVIQLFIEWKLAAPCELYRGESSKRDEIDKLVAPTVFLRGPRKVSVIQAQQSGIMDRSFQRSISLRGYPVDSGFGDEPGGQLKRDHSGSPSGDWRGTGKFGRISWITNEERNDIKLTDFRTHNHGTNSVRQRVDRVEMKEREKTIASR